ILLPVLHALRLKSSNGYLFKTVRVLSESQYCGTIPHKLEEYEASDWNDKNMPKVVGKEILQGIQRILKESSIKLEVSVVTKEENKVPKDMIARLRSVKKPDMIKREYGPPRRTTPPLQPQIAMDGRRAGGHILEVIDANCGCMRAPGTMGF